MPGVDGEGPSVTSPLELVPVKVATMGGSKTEPPEMQPTASVSWVVEPQLLVVRRTKLPETRIWVSRRWTSKRMRRVSDSVGRLQETCTPRASFGSAMWARKMRSELPPDSDMSAESSWNPSTVSVAHGHPTTPYRDRRCLRPPRHVL